MAHRSRERLDEQPTLGARALMAALDELCRARGLVGFRVGYKTNAKGEHVVAVVFPPQQP
jgi:predicted membrane GTPase involved in stress response